MYDAYQLRNYIREVLEDFSEIVDKTLDTEDAVELLMFTAAHESKLGTYLRQLNNGPAKGLFQIEPATWTDVYASYLMYRPNLLKAVQSFEIESAITYHNMMGNLPLQIIIARIIYLRDPEQLPHHTDIEGMAEIYKRVWNSHLGSATIEGAIGSYKKYVKGE